MIEYIDEIKNQLVNVSDLICKEHENINSLFFKYSLDVASCGHVEDSDPPQESITLKAHELLYHRIAVTFNLTVNEIMSRISKLEDIYQLLSLLLEEYKK